MSYALGAALKQLQDRVDILEPHVKELQEANDYLKEIVLNAMMKNNPEFKRNAVLSDMDSFLRKKIGRTRPPIQNQG